MRKHYLDNIRWATVLLVLLYHVFYMFNGVDIPGGISGAASIPAFDTAACILYPWFMVLLFAVAGISARYALQTHTCRQFIRERAVKLLVPSTLGLFVIHWITGYWNMKIGGVLEYIPGFLVYPIAAVSGIGPLWFIQMLFLFSCILVFLRKADKDDKLWAFCAKANLPSVLALFVVIFGGAQILNMPVFTMYRFGIYFAAFMIGYYVFSHSRVQDTLETYWLPMLVFAVFCAVCYGVIYAGKDFTAPDCLQSPLTNLYLWIAVLAVLGCGKRFFNFETAVTRYMTRASFGIYILHYPVLLSACYILHTYFAFPPLWNYAIALAAEIIVTFPLYEIVKRIPLIRYLVLGAVNKATG